MNLVNYEVTGMEAVYDAIAQETQRLGLEIESAEIVGLVPRAALNREAAYFSKLENFSEAKILENQIAKC
jgi:glutamate formiminotransferase